MSKAPRCSVVIPAYKCEAYIAECLESVQKQTVEDIEILVIDDCSPDNMAEIVMEYGENDSRIRYIKMGENRGVAAARNRGVQQAKSGWIAFLDSDDAWAADKLEKQFGVQEKTGAELIYAAARCMDRKGELTGRFFRVPEQIEYEELIKGNDIVCSSVLVKREWLLKYPMERSNLHEDYLCWLRLLRDGCRAAGIDAPLVRYRLTEGSKSRNKGRAARMTWDTLKVIGVPFVKRCGCFCGYALHGMKRYFT